MIEFLKGDIFKSECEVLVNPVNCVGVMGKGLALQFKNRYPKMFNRYKYLCKEFMIKPGKVYLYEPEYTNEPKIIFFPTKWHWNEKSSIMWIKIGLQDMVKQIKGFNIKSIAIPALGCGCGKLSWDRVKEVIKNELKDLEDIEIKVYEPL